MIRVFGGSNWYLLKSEIDRLGGEFVTENGPHSLEKIDAGQADYGYIINALQSVSMFEPKKLVIIYGLSKNKKASEQITEIIEGTPPDTDLIIVETELDKRSSYYKYLRKQPGFKDFGELTENEMPRWLIDYSKTRQANISMADARYLIERVGSSQGRLANEIDKLAQYDKNITKTSIDELTVPSPRSTIFNLIDAAFSGDSKRAIKIYEEQRVQKVEPQAIMGMIVWQMHIVAMCAVAKDRRGDDIAKQAGLNGYVVGKSLTIAKQMGISKVNDFLKLLRDIEATSRKQTYDYDNALKYAILTLGR